MAMPPPAEQQQQEGQPVEQQQVVVPAQVLAERRQARALRRALEQQLGPEAQVQMVALEAQLQQAVEQGLRNQERLLLGLMQDLLPRPGTPITGEPPGPETTPRKRPSPSDAPT